MNTKRALTISTLAALCLAIAANSAPWSVSEHQDDMTDEFFYLVSVAASNAIEIRPSVTYKPEIVLRIHPRGYSANGKMLHWSESFLAIQIEGLVRSGNDITVRFDREKATTENWSSSTDRRAAFHPNSKAFISDILSHTNLIVRYETSLGSIRTSKFDITGLLAAFQKVKALYAKRKPPAVIPAARDKEESPTPAPTAAPTPTAKIVSCSKCQGRGTIVAQSKCSKCGGTGRIYASGKWQSCPKVETSGKRKCRACDGTGKITVIE